MQSEAVPPETTKLSDLVHYCSDVLTRLSRSSRQKPLGTINRKEPKTRVTAPLFEDGFSSSPPTSHSDKNQRDSERVRGREWERDRERERDENLDPSKRNFTIDREGSGKDDRERDRSRRSHTATAVKTVTNKTSVGRKKSYSSLTPSPSSPWSPVLGSSPQEDPRQALQIKHSTSKREGHERTTALLKRSTVGKRNELMEEEGESRYQSSKQTSNPFHARLAKAQQAFAALREAYTD